MRKPTRQRNRTMERYMDHLAQVAAEHRTVSTCVHDDLSGVGEISMPGRGKYSACGYCLRTAEKLLTQPHTVLYLDWVVTRSLRSLDATTAHGVPVGRVLEVRQRHNNFCRSYRKYTMTHVVAEDLHGQRWYGETRGEGRCIKLHRCRQQPAGVCTTGCSHTRDLEEESSREYERAVAMPDPILDGNCEQCGLPKIDHYYMAREGDIPSYEGCDEAKLHARRRAASRIAKSLMVKRRGV